MDKNTALNKILLVYSKRNENFQKIISSFDCKIALLKRKKKHNLLILQNLLRQQLLLLTALEENSTKRSLWKLSRQSRFWEDNCHCNDDQFFKTHFRMTRASFDVLCDLLSNLNKINTKWGNTIALPKRVAIALFALSSSREYRVVSDLFGVGKSTVCVILNEFCKEVWLALSPQYLNKFPLTQETITECVDGFHRLGFPQCLGAIDGCHIEIRPKSSEATKYLNYKGWYSTVLLALVDYRCRFLYINVDAPGSSNDSRIYNSSLIKKELTNSEILKANMKELNGVQMPIYILGDSAFRFSKTLMKPYAFTSDLTEEQKFFNYKLSKCRRVVENAFVNLKARFRRVVKGINNRNGIAPSIIRACCVLHNFLNERNDDVDEIWLENLKDFEKDRKYPIHNVTIDDNEHTAEVIRQNLCHYFRSCDEWNEFGAAGDNDFNDIINEDSELSL